MFDSFNNCLIVVRYGFNLVFVVRMVLDVRLNWLYDVKKVQRHPIGVWRRLIGIMNGTKDWQDHQYILFIYLFLFGCVRLRGSAAGTINGTMVRFDTQFESFDGFKRQAMTVFSRQLVPVGLAVSPLVWRLVHPASALYTQNV
jgi:hypothetical protein